MLVTLLSSSRDSYGNCYHAVTLSNHGSILATGKISAPNINTWELRESLNWEYTQKVLPIRQFNKLTKSYPYIGSSWDDIKTNLLKGLNHASN